MTHITKNSFRESRIKIVRFTADSKLKIIETNAFLNSKLESLSIPSSVVVELQPNFLKNMEFITNIEIIKNEIENFRLIDGKLIV